METFSLKEFIEASLSDICQAVEAARIKHDYIAPKIFIDPNKDAKATLVEFDIAVTVINSESSSSKNNAKVGAGLKIGVIRAEAGLGENKKKQDLSSISKESRIKFSVPVYFRLNNEKREKILSQKASRNHKVISEGIKNDKNN